MALKVKKEGNSTVNSPIEIDMIEKYTGYENTITSFSDYHMKFICQFENIHSYPFDIEICQIVMVDGGSTDLVHIHPTRY